MESGVARCNAYADGVLAGDILAPRTIKQAARRYKKNLKDKRFTFDERAANAAVHNMERFKHAKGKQFQGKRIILEPWQCFVVCQIFGFKWRDTGLRLFNKVYERVPRKNGKSLLAILIAIIMFGPDKEAGAEVYLGATSQEQAKELLFLPARYIINNNKPFKRKYGVQVNASTIVIPSDFSTLKAVIKEPDDGASPHCAIVDEYHKHKTSKQYDVFDTGMGAREQPLLMVTTTAGDNLGGPCKKLDDDCLAQLRGEFDQPNRLVIIYAPDKNDKWNSLTTLRKVNPNIGVSVSEKYLIEQLEVAKRRPEKQPDFRTKHLNEWVGSASPWLNPLKWQRNSKPKLFDKFRGFSAHAAADLASRKDCNSITVIWKNDKGEYYSKTWFFVPEAALEVVDDYKAYQISGELVVTPGNATDQAYIEKFILELHQKYSIRSWAFDDYQGDYIMTRLQDQGLNVINYGQNVKNMSQPMKEVEALTDEGAFYNDGNACMSWMIGNVFCYKDLKDNIYPRKANKDDPKCKIDGPVSCIMAMGRWLQDDEPPGRLDDFLDNPIGAG